MSTLYAATNYGVLCKQLRARTMTNLIIGRDEGEQHEQITFGCRVP